MRLPWLRAPHNRTTFLGLAAKTQNRPEEAIAHFQQVIRIDPNDVGANVNLGQLYAQQRKYPEAIAVLRLALAAEPYNATRFTTSGRRCCGPDSERKARESSTSFRSCANVAAERRSEQTILNRAVMRKRLLQPAPSLNW